jgi:NADH-quinone oxidoreductase subunit M
MANVPTFGILGWMTFLPLITALVLMILPEKGNGKIFKLGALTGALLTLIVSVFVYAQFNPNTFHFQMVEQAEWIPSLGIAYRLGVDGISIWLVLITNILSVLSLWFSMYITDRIKTYVILMLILQTAMLGVFLSLDLILFYIFFEATLIPMFFLIAIWGGAKRAYASIKFFIYTFGGSIFLLIGLVAMYLINRDATGVGTFNLIEWQASVAQGQMWINALYLQPILFWAFAVALLIKCPVFPLHTWLPDAHTEAPTAGSIILAGVLLKMGTYGFFRFLIPLFPDYLPHAVVPLVTLGVIGIIYGALVAVVQPDMKRLVAYSSVAHMGFIVVGVFSLTVVGMVGASFQQLAHGFSTGALFLLIGLIYERRHTRMFADYGGIKAQMPIFSALFLIVVMSSVGLPATNGFVGEFMALLGLFQASWLGWGGLNIAFAVVAALGTVLAAVYLLTLFMKVFYGKNENPENLRLKDLKSWEIALVGVFVVFIFWGGLYPKTFLEPMQASIQAARMMALNPVGLRPMWSQPKMEIDSQGNLVLVDPADRGADAVTTSTIIAPANIYSKTAAPLLGRNP